MATFKNRKTGETFEVDDPTPFAARPARYEPVDVYACEECGQTFKSPQALGGHTRSHED